MKMHMFILIGLFTVGLLAGLVRSIYFCFMVRNRRAGVKAHDFRLYLSVFTSHELLTEKGISWRNKSLKYSIIFVSAFLIFFFVASSLN